MAFNHKFGQVSLVCHSFNANSTEMAISLNSKDVFIFKVPQITRGKFVFLDRLQQHSAVVRSIDWAPKTDRIVSCSKDRNAYVWTRDGNTWKPVLVILQLNRAATFIRWSPEENKFACGSAAKVISVCSFEPENDFWVSKQLKKGINSTVTCLDWHPDNCVLACGSTDFKVRIFGVFLRPSGDKSKQTDNPWGSNTKFHTLMWESNSYSGNHGWIHSVKFSLDGNKVAWSCHGSIIGIATATSQEATPTVVEIEMSILPLQTLIWVGPNTIVGAGHDYVPYLFKTDPNGSSLSMVGSLDSQEKSNDNQSTKAKDHFMRMTREGTTDSSMSQVKSVHRNTINELRIMKTGSNNTAEAISSVGRDGQIVLWDMKTLATRMAELRIS